MWVAGGRTPHLAQLQIEQMEDVVEHDSVADKQAGSCPMGHGLMVRAKTFVDGGFYLERCPTCFGIWFDRGEWQRVLQHGLADGLHEIWSSSWQTEQIRLQQERNYSQQLTMKLGDLVSEIDQLTQKLEQHPQRSLAIGYLMQRLREKS